MKGNDIDKLIGDKLRDYREEPSPALFDRIEKTLARSGKDVAAASGGKRGAFFYAWRIGAAAVVLMGLVLGYNAIRNNGEVPLPGINVAATNEVDTLENGAVNIDDTMRPADILSPENAGSETDGRTPSGHARLRNNTSESGAERLIGSDGIRIGAGAGKTDSNAARITRDDIEGAAESPPRTSVKDPARSDDKDSTVRKEDKTVPADLKQPIDEYWEELLRGEEKQRRRKSDRRMSGSLYAGNLGTGTGDFTSSDPKALITNSMTIVELSGVESDENGPAVMHAPNQSPPASNNNADTELTHSMPVNYGLTLGIPLTERLTLVTGLNYAYLTSRSSQSASSSGNVNSLRRESHYIGIPIDITYSLYSRKSLGIYVSGGFMIERAVYAREVTTYGFDSGETRLEQRIKPKGVTPSVRASAGLSLRLGGRFDLYVEPGVAYYFEQLNALTSYRTQYPVNFSLTAGVRFNL